MNGNSGRSGVLNCLMALDIGLWQNAKKYMLYFMRLYLFNLKEQKLSYDLDSHLCDP